MSTTSSTNPLKLYSYEFEGHLHSQPDQWHHIRKAWTINLLLSYFGETNIDSMIRSLETYEGKCTAAWRIRIKKERNHG